MTGADKYNVHLSRAYNDDYQTPLCVPALHAAEQSHTVEFEHIVFRRTSHRHSFARQMGGAVPRPALCAAAAMI